MTSAYLPKSFACAAHFATQYKCGPESETESRKPPRFLCAEEEKGKTGNEGDEVLSLPVSSAVSDLPASGHLQGEGSAAAVGAGDGLSQEQQQQETGAAGSGVREGGDGTAAAAAGQEQRSDKQAPMFM